jgi:hypothetical protein
MSHPPLRTAGRTLGIAEVLDSLNSAYQRRIARSLRKAAGVALGYVPQANKRILEADAVIGDVPERVEEAIRLDDLNAMPTGPDPQEVARSMARSDGPDRTPDEQRRAMNCVMRAYGDPMPS